MNYIDQFFQELDKKIEYPVKVILTGAMAGIILGNIRPSMDIDFEIEFSSAQNPSGKLIQQIELAIQEVSKKLNLPAQYSENIQGWSQISFLNYREESKLYKRIGKIEIHLLSPLHWSIGKLARYLELDAMDVVYVFRKHAVSWNKTAHLWGKALDNSSRSDKSREFREHVIDFFASRGKKVWGSDFEAAAAIQEFKSSAGIL